MGILLGALDIGTQTTTLLAAECEGDKLNVVGHVLAQTSGVKKGVIRNIDEVTACVRHVREEMKKVHDVELFDVVASFSAGDIKSFVRTGKKSLLPGHAIDEMDVAEAEDNAWSAEAADAPDTQLQRFRQKYEVNGQPVNTPLGMTGSELVSNVLELTAPRSALESVRTAVHRAGLRLSDIVFSGVAVADAVLDRKARDEGAVVIDFGAGTCDYIALCNGVVAAAGTLAIGGSHLTNDLALAFQATQGQAEEMKLARGAAMIQPDLAGERYLLRTAFSTSDRSVSVHAIQTVTTERVDETFRLLRDLLADRGVLPHIHGGLWLTGGTAALPLIAEQASAIFGLPCTLGVPANFVSLPDSLTAVPFRHATALGLLRWRARTLSQEERNPTLLSRLRNFLRG